MKKRGRPRNPDSVLNYFPETEMVDILKEYKMTKSDETFKLMEPRFIAIINGMINKEFSYNSYIKNNREDAIANCLLAIMSSYQRFDPEKGRLYAYTNRIVKNTLRKMSEKLAKLQSKEVTYTDINMYVESENNTEDNVINISLSSDDTVSNDTSEISNILEKCTLKNVTLDAKSTINIVYFYIKYVKDTTAFFLKNSYYMDELIKDIIYDADISFDFNKYINQGISEKRFYHNLIEHIDFVLDTLLKWINCKYHNYLIDEPESFDGKLSDRVIGNIRTFIITTFNGLTLGSKLDADELIYFIQYITINRYLKYDK